MKADWRAYFGFSKQRFVALFIFLCAFVLLSIIWLYVRRVAPVPLQYSTHTLDSVLRFAPQEFAIAQHLSPTMDSVRMFFFDPNTADEQTWVRLGVRAHTRKSILKYVAKGGRFRRAEDLQKIYNLPAYEYARLRPYIRIVSPATTIKNTSSLQVDIACANEIQLRSLRGIGDVRAARIIKYRTLLGGFYKVEQVGEVYGIDSLLAESLYPYLTLSMDCPVHKIPINTADFYTLKKHPYIGSKMASAILQYRQTKGRITSAHVLSVANLCTPGQLAKLLPYIDFE